MSNNGNIMCVHLASIKIADQNYNFTFHINEKLEDLNITLLIDGTLIAVPFDCVRKLVISCNSITYKYMHMYFMYTGISDEMRYCIFRIANMEYSIGTHTLTFLSILNGKVRGSTDSRFFLTDSKLILFP